MTTMSRDTLKVAVVQRLAQVAVEHPAGHQGKLAARFILRTTDGERIELMFEKGPASPANLWVCERFVRNLDTTTMSQRLSPGGALYKMVTDDGKKIYGRHAALRSMPQLCDADLVCLSYPPKIGQ
jgi:hypothetical protein